MATDISLSDPLLLGKNPEDTEANLEGPVTKKKSRTPRLQSLDVLRGLTIAVMIFVDFAGETTPAVDHTPWNGATLADFVVPSFDFMLGVSIALSIRSGRLKTDALLMALKRFAKLFILGVLTQAGTAFPTYDLRHLRIMGILQRVAVCYLVAAVTEILLCGDIPENRTSPFKIGKKISSHVKFHWHRKFHWFVFLGLCSLYAALIYGVKADWHGSNCEVGDTEPECNAAGWIDSRILGVSHMYFPTNGGAWEDKDFTFQRLSDCSSCSPGASNFNFSAHALCVYTLRALLFSFLPPCFPFFPSSVLSSQGRRDDHPLPDFASYY
jgi:hypothetical protein